MSKNNYALVEGEFKNYVFRKIQPEDWNKVIQHIQDYFMRDEPFCKLVGYNEQFGSEIAHLARKMLADDLSFLVEEKETCELAAVRVTFRHTRETNTDDILVTSQEGKALFKYVTDIEEKANLFNRFDIKEYADFFVASTHPRFRNEGIMSEMYSRNLKFLQTEGFRMAKSVFTSPYVRRAVTKLGFEEVVKYYFSEFEMEKGKVFFSAKDLTSEHFGSIMVKHL